MLLYTALGDSITTGEDATAQNLAYPSRVLAFLNKRGHRVSGDVIAAPGWTSRALDDAVQNGRSPVLRFSRVVSIWVGGDDLGRATLAMLHGANRRVLTESIHRYGQNLVVLLRNLRKSSKARVFICTQYNPFPNSPLASVAIGQLNAVTVQIGSQFGATVVPTAAWFEGRQSQLIAGYRTGRIEDALRSTVLPIHPNNAGHLAIAQGLAPMISAAL